MLRLPFPWVVALRFLREGRSQTLLISLAVTVGVAVIVFLSALIGGLQADIIARTLGSQAHVVVHPPDEVARELPGATLGLSRIQKAPQRLRSVAQWQPVIEALARLPGVAIVTPTLQGPAFASRASADRNVNVKGIEPEGFEGIVSLASKVRSGKASVFGNTALVGSELAGLLGMGLGDRFRILAGDGRGDTFSVGGIFDFGNKDANERLVLVALPAAQTLFDLPGGATSLELRVNDIFEAENTARSIVSQTGLAADSWMATNEQLLAALRAQSGSSAMIQFFVVVAVALGISSVLAVSVVQKSKEIGILKAVGTSTGQIMGIFLLQGGILGLVGSLVGSGLGWGLAALFRNVARNPDGTPRFPLELEPRLFAVAILVATVTGLVAALLPARRAARLDPATVIRGN